MANYDELNHIMIHKNEELMNDMIRNYFSTEDFGVKATKTITSHEEERSKELIEKTFKKENGKYDVGLLWKTENVRFPDSYNHALRRLESLEKQIKRDTSLQENVRRVR